MNVRFIPTASGQQSATLNFFGVAITPVNVKLQGTGIATSNSVYAQPVGGTNAFYTFAGTTPAVSAISTTSGLTAYFVLRNNSLLPVNLGSDATLFTGSDVGFDPSIGRPVDFSVTKATTTAAGAGVACGTGNLAAAGFCTFAVTFKPLLWDAVAGVGTRTRWAAVRVGGVGGNNILGVIGQVQQPAKLQLSATATSAVKITGTTSPFTVDFGQLLQGQTPSLTFTITNIGQAPTAGAPGLNLTTIAGPYATIGTSTCGTGTTALAAGANCTVVVNSQLTSTIGVQSGITVTAVDPATGGSGETAAESYILTAAVVNPLSLVVAPSVTAFTSTQAGVMASPRSALPSPTAPVEIH